MRRDMARLTAERGLRLTWPETFPANGLTAARLALMGESRGFVAPFTRAVFAAEFEKGRDIADRDLLAEILSGLGLDARALLEEAGSPAVKAALAARCEEAVSRDVFGAPTFFAPDGELFWGDDRLEQAIAWTLSHAGPAA